MDDKTLQKEVKKELKRQKKKNISVAWCSL